MKIHFCLFIATTALLWSCKKDNHSGSNSTGYQTFSPATIAPTQPGMLVVSQNTLVLHVNASATVTAKIYNSDGTPAATQPAFTWTVNNSQIASVANGTITALSTGFATVAVTDGTHGYDYVQVNVVADSVTISQQVACVTFNPPFISLKAGATANFSYTVTNLQGQLVSATPLFSSSSPITVSTSSVQAGNTTGYFNIIAVNGTDTLHGVLPVLVYNGQVNTPDTTYTISKLITYPQGFNKNGLVADPVRIEITQTIQNGSNISIQKFQTSPDAIGIAYPSIVTVNSNGCITSVGPGTTPVILTYKNQQVTCESSTTFDGAGTWSNGTVTVCVPEVPDQIIYFMRFALPVSASAAKLSVNGCNNGLAVIPNQTCNFADAGFGSEYTANGGWIMLNPGPTGPKPSGSPGLGVGGYTFSDCQKTINPCASYIDQTHVKLATSFGDQTLTLGTGSCGGSAQAFSFNGTNYTIDTTVCGVTLPGNSGTENTIYDTSGLGIAIGVYNAPSSGSISYSASNCYLSSYPCDTCTCYSCPGVVVVLNYKSGTQAILYTPVSGTITKSGNTITYSAVVTNGTNNYNISGSITCP